MRTTIYLTDGGYVDVGDMDPGSLLELKAELNAEHPLSFLTFDLDGETIIVNREQIVRIDVETGA